MCGIVGYTGEQNAAPILLEGLKKLEYRGYDSCGVAVIDEGKISIRKVTGRIDHLVKETREGECLPGTVGIGHTRWATHGAPTDQNAHPHVSSDGRFAIVHNGIIENYQLLREELKEKGYSFSSETDTEVIVHLIEMYYEGDPVRALMKASSRLRGSYAVGMTCTDAPEKVFVARESSPLILGIGIGENYFASDVTALVEHTKNVIYLDDGEYASISPDGITVCDCTGATVRKEISRVSWDVQAAEKGGYEHFMLKEIMEQPRAVGATISPRVKEGRISPDEMNISGEELKKIDRIIITACGSAYYAGCSGRYVIEKLCGLPVQVELASELRYADPMIDSHTLLIVLSQSGETADTIAAMKECQSRGARTLAVVNVVGSTVAKLADSILYTWAGPEIAVATTKGYTTQLMALYLFALYAGRELGRVDDGTYDTLLNELLGIPKRIQQALDMNPSIPALAKKYHGNQSIFFIGRNTDWAVAMEGALKMKEISYLHAEAYAAGELKHGTIALVHEGQPVVALCCNEKLSEKTVSNIVEVKARGAEVLAVTFRGMRDVISQADDIIYVPKVNTLFSAILEIVPMQLLAYYVARENGCDIDKPKNLAKSVTVE